MSGTLRVNSVGNVSGTYTVTGTYLVSRVVQRQTVNYRDGWYRPIDTYYWAPGCWLWFQPSRSDTHIRFSMNMHLRWYNSAHSISHWIFYVDDVEYGRHSVSNHHQEGQGQREFMLPSWGAGKRSQIGYRIRSYNSGTHNIHMNHTGHWDGGGRNIDTPSMCMVEEVILGYGQSSENV